MQVNVVDAERVGVDAQNREALRDYWEVLQPARSRIEEALRKAVAQFPEIVQAMRAMTPEQQALDAAKSEKAQELALIQGDWKPLMEHLTSTGRIYAERGVSFGAWFEVLSIYRMQFREVLRGLAKDELAKAMSASEGLDHYVNVCMRCIGEAYLETKQTLITRQQEAIRELSTPVLQVRDRLLIIPVVGMVDTLRARHLTEELLRAIREKRARAVVMDITGVPIVDSRVANHLVLACEAARLMGADVFMTGISSSIAQALVTIGAELRGVPTLGDLQTGLEAAEALLRRSALQSDAEPTAAGKS